MQRAQGGSRHVLSVGITTALLAENVTVHLTATMEEEITQNSHTAIHIITLDWACPHRTSDMIFYR